MNFCISGLSPEPFQRFFGLSDAELQAHGIHRYIADEKPGFPDRIELLDAKIGETALLLNHVCQDAMTPYRASHAIFVREGATNTYDAVNQISESMRLRLLSLRGYSASGMMFEADVVEGTSIETLIEQIFANQEVSYIHVHNARRGCYAVRVDRA
jgi:hypothetical protein